MAILTASFARSLMPGVNQFTGMGYNEYPEQWRMLFQVEQTDRNYEEDYGTSYFGLTSVKPEGTAGAYDVAQQLWPTRYQTITYFLGYLISREAIEDNQYKDLYPRFSKALGMSMRQTKENVAANIFNRAFTSGYTGGDGKVLAATDHLLGRGGSFANRPSVGVDLSELSLEQGAIAISQFTNDANLKVAIRPRLLLVHPSLQFEAKRILGGDMQVNSAENNINAMKAMGTFSMGFTVNNYLTDDDAWFILTDCPDGLKFFERRPLTIENDTSDFDTENMKVKATMRFSLGWTDPHCVYGSPGA